MNSLEALFTLSVIIILVVGAYIIRTKEYELSGIIIGGLMILWVPGSVISAVQFSKTKYETIKYEYKDVEISTLKDGTTQSIHGSFFLGIGSVDGNSRTSYSFYINHQKGSKLMSVDINNRSNVYINETDSISPRIKDFFVRKIFEKTSTFWYWNDEIKIGEWEENRNTDIIIYVPKNTIYKNFTLNK